jgi:hypothetical protein
VKEWDFDTPFLLGNSHRTTANSSHRVV